METFKGKIYRIYDKSNRDEYIGSTSSKYLCQRKAEHIYDMKRYDAGISRYISSFKVLRNNNYNMEVIEEGEFRDKKQFRDKEKYYIRKSKEDRIYNNINIRI